MTIYGADEGFAGSFAERRFAQRLRAPPIAPKRSERSECSERPRAPAQPVPRYAGQAPATRRRRYADRDQPFIRSFSQSAARSVAMRSCAMESRSRTVTPPVSRVSPSTVMQNGVPASSMRR